MTETNEAFRCFKCPYQAKVIKVFEMMRRRTVDIRSIVSVPGLPQAHALNSIGMATNLAPGVVPVIGALAQSSGVREALQWFTREKQWINEQHLELCRIPSPTFLEHQRAEWIATQFRGYGCDVQI